MNIAFLLANTSSATFSSKLLFLFRLEPEKVETCHLELMTA